MDEIGTQDEQRERFGRAKEGGIARTLYVANFVRLLQLHLLHLLWRAVGIFLLDDTSLAGHVFMPRLASCHPAPLIAFCNIVWHGETKVATSSEAPSIVFAFVFRTTYLASIFNIWLDACKAKMSFTLSVA